MKNALLVIILLAISCSPVMAQMEASVGAGVITVGGNQVSNSPVVKGDFFANLNQYLALGFSVGEAVHFNKNDGRIEVRDNGLMPASSFATTKTPSLILNHNKIPQITNTFVTITPGKPLTIVDMTEQSYFFGEPTVRLSFPIGIVTPYAKGFAGATVLRTYGGESIGAFSSGYGGGLKISLGALFVNWEWLHRQIEANRTTYNHDQFTGSVGWGFR
jgi:hypothetical protein